MPRNGVKDDVLAYIRELAEARDSSALHTIVQTVIDEIAREVGGGTTAQEELLDQAVLGADALINFFEFGPEHGPRDRTEPEDWEHIEAYNEAMKGEDWGDS